MTRNRLRIGLLLSITGLLSTAIAHADDTGAMPDCKLSGHAAAVTAVAFSPDNKRVASVDDSGVLKVWDVAAKKELFSFDGVRAPKKEVQFTPDGKSVVAIVTGGIGFFDPATGKAQPTLAVETMQSGPSAFDISVDGKFIAVVGRGALKVYELGTPAPKVEWEVHANYSITAVAFSPDGKRVATASTDHTSLVVDWATGNIVATLNLTLNGVAAVFTLDGKRVLTWAEDASLRSFDAATGEGEVLSELGNVKTMSLSADGKCVICSDLGRGPGVINMADKKLSHSLYDSESLIYSAAGSPDGKWLVGGSNDGCVFLWKAR